MAAGVAGCSQGATAAAVPPPPLLHYMGCRSARRLLPATCRLPPAACCPVPAPSAARVGGLGAGRPRRRRASPADLPKRGVGAWIGCVLLHLHDGRVNQRLRGWGQAVEETEHAQQRETGPCAALPSRATSQRPSIAQRRPAGAPPAANTHHLQAAQVLLNIAQPPRPASRPPYPPVAGEGP